MDRPEHCGKPMQTHGRAGSGAIRWYCSVCGFRTTLNSNGADTLPGWNETLVSQNLDLLHQAIKEGQKRFVVTAAQNNTRANARFLESLERYCNHWGAYLIVLPIHYKNISLYTANQQYRKWWPREIEKYLIDERVYLGGGIELSDVRISATAADPLSGLRELGEQRWQIYGHSQVAMEPVATPSDLPPKRLYTTGVVTQRNYSKSKYGAKADFHHTNAAIVVEIASRTTCFVRQLVMEPGGAFFDVAGGIVGHYKPDEIVWGARPTAITTGDEHVKFHARSVFKGTYGPEGMVPVLKPEHIVRHDVLDGYAGSHHHHKQPLVQFRKWHVRDDDYRAELEQVARFINETTPKDCLNVMVDSNHHDHLQKFLDKADANKDHINAIFIAEMQQAQREAIIAGEDYRPLRLYCEPRLKCETLWLERNTPFLLNGVDYSQHGDVGVNGARGSAKAMAGTTFKAVVGHSHSPKIVKGVYQVGKSSETMEYERGLSTHAHTHCIQYPNGKRSLIDIAKNGTWHLKETA